MQTFSRKQHRDVHPVCGMPYLGVLYSLPQGDFQTIKGTETLAISVRPLLFYVAACWILYAHRLGSPYLLNFWATWSGSGIWDWVDFWLSFIKYRKIFYFFHWFLYQIIRLLFWGTGVVSFAILLATLFFGCFGFQKILK